MKNTEIKRASVIMGVVAYLLCGMAMYIDIPKRIVSVIRDIENITEDAPLIIYSEKNIEEMKRQCRCWIGCSCIINRSNSLIKKIGSDSKEINILTISPADIKVILAYKISSTPIVITQKNTAGIKTILEYTLYDTIGVFSYTVDGLVDLLIKRFQGMISEKGRSIIRVGGIILCLSAVVKDAFLHLYRRKQNKSRVQ